MSALAIDYSSRAVRRRLINLRCKDDLHFFIKQAWPIVYPNRPFQDNWHIEVICRHLEQVARGTWKRLAINVPVRTSKSSIVSVFWPAWRWISNPGWQCMSVTNEMQLATRDTRRMRLLVQNDWFLDRWPMTFARDQNQRTYFENDDMGHRQGLGVTSNLQGKDADGIILDDVLDREAAISQVEREKVCEIVEESVLTRLNDPAEGTVVAIGQRTHQMDHFGKIYEEGGWDRLVIPMEYEEGHPFPSTTGFVDHRKPGELMWPSRFPPELMEREKRFSYKWAGQFQQRPSPRGGALFEVDRFQILDVAPSRDQFDSLVRYWDKASMEGEGDYTAGVLMGRIGDRYYVIDVVRGQWNVTKRNDNIDLIASTDLGDYDGKVLTILEVEGGSGGKESGEISVRRLAGVRVQTDHPTGSKEVRAEPFADQVGAGNVYLIKGRWNRDYIEELRHFPFGAHDDQCDASSAAFSKLALIRRRWIVA